MDKKITIMAIGCLPPPIGGVTVLFQVLVDALKERQDVKLVVVNTGRIGGAGLCGVFRFFRLLWRVLTGVSKVDIVSLHCTTVSTLGFPIFLISRIFRKPFVLRKNAGDDYRETRGLWYRWAWLGEFVVRRSNIYLPETRHLVSQARERGFKNVVWFPNHRPFRVEDVYTKFVPRSVCRRFVFVGQVRERKGIRFLVAAAKKLADSVTIDVYGPWFDDLERDIFDTTENISYGGVISPGGIADKLREYDALVLPTFHVGEGYPGVILEAFGAGLPVIATRCGAISEIVDENVGILIEQKNVEELYGSINRLANDADLYHRLCSNVRGKADLFSANRWMSVFVALCRSLDGKRPKK